MSEKNNTIVQEQDIIEFANALEDESINQQIETLKMRQAELEETRNTNRLYLRRIQQQSKDTDDSSYQNRVFEQLGPFLTTEDDKLHAAKIKDIHERRVAENALKVFDEDVLGFDQTSFNNIVDSPFGDTFITHLKKSKKSKGKTPTKSSKQSSKKNSKQSSKKLK